MQKRYITLFILISFLFLLTPISLLAEDVTSQCTSSNVNEKIACLEKKRDETHQKGNTLSSLIQEMDAQIYIKTLTIQQTEQKITETQHEIDTLTTRINGLDTSLNTLSKLLIQRVVNGYKKQIPSLIDIFLSSQSMGNLISTIKYQKTTQDNNQQLLLQVQEAKTNYEEQKTLRETKKKELDNLIINLDAQKNDLSDQKNQKEILLVETKRDESKYQELIAQAQAEHNAVQQALITGSRVGPVKKGDPIALVGNTGYPYCSTGAHLHFEIRINNNWVNAENYLSPKSVQDDQDNGTQTIGGGGWDWPLQDPVEITQRYGHTPWSWRYNYSGGIHTGIDMISSNSQVIRAPADGILYSSTQACGSATINVKYIDHGNNTISYYLHVQ